MPQSRTDRSLPVLSQKPGQQTDEAIHTSMMDACLG